MITSIKILIVCGVILLSTFVTLKKQIVFVVVAELLWVTTYTSALVLGAWSSTNLLFGLSFFVLLFAAVEVVFFFLVYNLHRYQDNMAA